VKNNDDNPLSPALTISSEHEEQRQSRR